MDQTGTIRLGNENYNFPLILGSEGEQAIDVRMLRSESGAIAFDEGYGNTGSCLSDITFVDGESGILRHRGYPIEELAEHSDFLETAYLIIYGELPNKEERKAFGRIYQNPASATYGVYVSLHSKNFVAIIL